MEETKSKRGIKVWLNEHAPEVLCAILVGSSLTAGFIIGEKYGVLQGMVDVKEKLAKVIPAIIDDCGSTGSNSLLNWLKREHIDVYEKVREVLDWQAVGDEYYSNSGIEAYEEMFK